MVQLTEQYGELSAKIEEVGGMHETPTVTVAEADKETRDEYGCADTVWLQFESSHSTSTAAVSASKLIECIEAVRARYA